MKRLFDLRTGSYDKNMSLNGKFDKKFNIFIKMGGDDDIKGFHKLNEIEKFQERALRRRKRLKNSLIGLGKQKAGVAYPKKVKNKRSRSAPAGYGGSQ